MAFKIILALVIIGTFLELSYELPLQSSKQEQALVEKFVEFLHQDKEIAQAIEHGNFNLREKRQAEENNFSDESDENVEPQKQDGFFDRAAKFVMEVLQRFLKWINTDN